MWHEAEKGTPCLRNEITDTARFRNKERIYQKKNQLRGSSIEMPHDNFYLALLECKNFRDILRKRQER